MKQKNNKSKSWKAVAVVAFALLSFFFWYKVSPSVLADREQTMLFLLTGDYFQQRLMVPGGFARYVGEFVTQFFCKANAGAVALTIVLLLVHWLTLVIFRRHGIGKTFWTYLLSFLPSAILWFMATSPTVTMTLITAIVIVIAAMALMPRRVVPSVVYTTVIVPLCYWLAGPATWLLVAYALFCWLRSMSSRLSALACGLAMSLLMFFFILASSYCVSYPTSKLMSGIDYYWDETYTPKFKQAMEVSDQMLIRGYVNGSQRYAFEVMELIPNYNKSARVLMRLAATSIITEQNELALKYISILEETLFYRKRAHEMRRFVENPELMKGTNYEILNKKYKTTADEFFI